MNLGTIRTMARDKADESPTSFIGNPEVNRYINQGLRNIYGKICQRFENYFITKGTNANGGLFSTTADVQEYALPTTMQKLVRVEHRQLASRSENDWLALQTLNIGNDRVRTFYPPREGYGPGPGFGYFIAGNNIYLRPTPSHVFEVRLWFIPRVTELSADTDIPVIPEEYHEMLAEYAAIQMLAKSGEGIWKERSDIFKVELDSLLESIEMRNQSSEQMIITDEYSFDAAGFTTP
jgi:hypothetical protein